MKISTSPHFRASLDLKYPELSSNVLGWADVDVIIFLSVLCCCLCLGVGKCSLEMATRWCTRYKRSSTLTDGWNLLILIRPYSSVRFWHTSCRKVSHYLMSRVTTYWFHVLLEWIQELLPHLLTVVDPPVTCSNQKSQLMLNIMGFKIPTKKTFNNIYIKIFKPVFGILWVKQCRESNEVG